MALQDHLDPAVPMTIGELMARDGRDSTREEHTKAIAEIAHLVATGAVRMTTCARINDFGFQTVKPGYVSLLNG